jgi:hypothetical protein
MKLNLDQLAVDSFDTSAAPEKRGTVFGEQCTCPTNCTCPGCPTCEGYATCGGDTCWETCAGQYSCDGTCDSCYFTRCAQTCWNCPTASGGVCECTL